MEAGGWGGERSAQGPSSPSPLPHSPHTHPLVPKVPPRRACPFLSLSSHIPAPELRWVWGSRAAQAAGRGQLGAPQPSGQAALCPAAQAPECDRKSRSCASPQNYVSVEHGGTQRNTEEHGGSPGRQDQAWARGGEGHLGFCPGPLNTPSSSHGHVLTPQVLTAPRSPPGKGRSLLCAVGRGAVLRVGTGGAAGANRGPTFAWGRSHSPGAHPAVQGPFRWEMGATPRGSGLAVALHLLFWKLKIKVRRSRLVWKP